MSWWTFWWWGAYMPTGNIISICGLKCRTEKCQIWLTRIQDFFRLWQVFTPWQRISQLVTSTFGCFTYFLWFILHFAFYTFSTFSCFTYFLFYMLHLSFCTFSTFGCFAYLFSMQQFYSVIPSMGYSLHPYFHHISYSTICVLIPDLI